MFVREILFTIVERNAEIERILAFVKSAKSNKGAIHERKARKITG